MTEKLIEYQSKLSKDRLRNYKNKLSDEQLGTTTIKIYMKEAQDLENYLLGTERLKKDVISYINDLKAKTVQKKLKGKTIEAPKYKLTTLNNKIIAINKYLTFTNEKNLHLKQFKIQDTDNVMTLTDNDFKRLLGQAEKKGTARDKLMLLAFYYTGLRVSELEYFTVESIKQGYMNVTNKGKTRIVGIPRKLVDEAKDYLANTKIKKGSIILNRNGQPLSRNYIFKRLKYLGGQARLNLDKVYPHSIRHLFAKNMVQKHNINPLQLADILGHESISTTRQYTKLGLEEVKKLMNF